MTEFNKYELPVELEIEADKAAEAYIRSVEDAADEAWMASQSEPEESIEEALDWLMDEVLCQLKFMRKRMKEAGASDEVLAILDRYRKNIPSILDEA